MDVAGNYSTKRALLIGHFSTVGDIEALRYVERRLRQVSMPFDVAPYKVSLIKSGENWVDAERIDPQGYTHLIVICGPFRRSYIEKNVRFILDRFNHCVRIGVDLTMLESVDAYNPFDVLLERDSDRICRPDLSMAEEVKRVPVAGLCLGNTRTHNSANNALQRLVQRANAASIELDTEWPVSRNKVGISSPEQFEAICSKVDVMLTTRLHGTVLAIKNGIPVIVIDCGTGGSKISRQANLIGWPEVFPATSVTDDLLDAAWQRCLLPAAREQANACAGTARKLLENFDQEFFEAIRETKSDRAFTRQPALRVGARFIRRKCRVK